MTWICWRGIELSARVQQFLLAAEIAVLAAFAIIAIVKVYANAPAGSVRISADWFNPFSLGFKPLVDGMLLGIFIYWGWDSGVAVNEETESSAEAPGRAAVVSTLILLAIYLVVSAAAQSYGGTGFLAQQLRRRPERARHQGVRLAVGQAPDHRGAHLGVGVDADHDPPDGAHDVVDGPLEVDPADLRPHPSEVPDPGRLHARHGRALDRLHGDPGRLQLSQDVLGDSITALGFAILFYYGFTGLACAVYFRKQLLKSWKHFLAGRRRAARRLRADGGDLRQGVPRLQPAGAGYAKPLFGIQIPIVIGIGSLLLGIPLMILCALKFREFFRASPRSPKRAHSTRSRSTSACISRRSAPLVRLARGSELPRQRDRRAAACAL